MGNGAHSDVFSEFILYFHWICEYLPLECQGEFIVHIFA